MTDPGPLRRRAVVALAVRMGVGLVLILAGWVGASDEVTLDRQTPWIAVSVAGALVGAGAAALWLLELRRAVRTRVLAVVAAVDGLPLVVADADDAVRVRRRGARLFHRPGCALVAGRTVAGGDAASWRAEGLEACEACEA
jgi:hypothetical protein